MAHQFTRTKANLLDFFLADVRNSRGKFDEMKEEFVINTTPIASQLSLNSEDHEEHKILLQILLIASRINQNFKKKRGIHHLLKDIFARKMRWGARFDGHDRSTIKPQSHVDRVTIARRSGHDRTLIVVLRPPRSTVR